MQGIAGSSLTASNSRETK